MSLFYDPGTNVAIGLFEPGYTSQYVSFDTKNMLYITSYQDDQKIPPSDDTPRKLYRWFVCEYDFEGYTYELLAWQVGSCKPENPTCQPIGVERVYPR